MLEPLVLSPDPAGDAVRAAHHQIGNSLQSVASFLTLESRSASPEAATVLSEAGRRVRVIMRLHQRLQVVSGDAVRLDDLLGDVIRDVAALDAVDRDAEIRVDLDPVVAPSRAASALAIITAEWVGNALEHGLADRAGVVIVTLERTAAGLHLSVSDSDSLASHREWKPGFGMSLVARLAGQLGATTQRTCDATGTRVALTWPGA